METYRLGLMTLRRLSPPRDALGELVPARVLPGHGRGVHDDAPQALADGLEQSRRRFPSALLGNGLDQIRTALAAFRS